MADYPNLKLNTFKLEGEEKTHLIIAAKPCPDGSIDVITGSMSEDIQMPKKAEPNDIGKFRCFNLSPSSGDKSKFAIKEYMGATIPEFIDGMVKNK